MQMQIVEFLRLTQKIKHKIKTVSRKVKEKKNIILWFNQMFICAVQ